MKNLFLILLTLNLYFAFSDEYKSLTSKENPLFSEEWTIVAGDENPNNKAIVAIYVLPSSISYDDTNLRVKAWIKTVHHDGNGVYSKMFIEAKCLGFMSDTIVKEYMILSDVVLHSNSNKVIRTFRIADEPTLQGWTKIPIHSYLDSMHYTLCMMGNMKSAFIKVEQDRKKREN